MFKGHPNKSKLDHNICIYDTIDPPNLWHLKHNNFDLVKLPFCLEE